MRFVARLASVKLAPLPLGGTTGGTSNGEYLFGAGFFFHGLASLGDGRPRCYEDTERG
jgi:hypothetical protein